MTGYTYRDLIRDLNDDVEWNIIREKALSSKLNLKDVPNESRTEVRQAINEYFRKKAPKEHSENSHIHYEVPHFNKPSMKKN